MHSEKETINKGNCSTEHDVRKDWRYWCRLCAKADMENINIYLTTGNLKHKVRLSIAIGKYFSVKIQQAGPLPNRLCAECFSLLTFLEDFKERVAKVQEMYIALQHKSANTEESAVALRLAYGISENERPHELMQKIHPSDADETTKNYEKQEQNLIEDAYTEEIVLSAAPPNAPPNDINKHENEFIIKAEKDEVIFDLEDTANVSEDPFASDLEHDSIDDEKNLTKTYTDQKSVTRGGRKTNKDISTKNSSKSNSVQLASAAALSSQTSTEFKYFCNKCPLRFQRIGNYRVHLNKKHGVVGYIPPFTCTHCSRSFKSEFFLKRHIKIHQPIAESELFPCPQCERKFKAKDYVATHIKLTHERIRSYICEECGEAIRTQDALRQHRLTHTDYAPFVCEICKKAFKDRARLKKHLEIHSSNKYTCGVCGLKLNSRTTLNQHKLVHSDEMRHKCDYCGRAFKRSKSLKSHLLLHSGIKPYSCKFCEKAFTSGSNCRLHMKKTHPIEFLEMEASGEKKYTKNIPKLAVLKSVIQTGVDLIPVASKQSGNFASCKKTKAPNDDLNSSEVKRPTPAPSSLAENIETVIS